LNSRLDLRDKKRKINKIYNISITIVCVLIVIVAITIFTGNDVEKTPKESAQSIKTEQSINNKTETKEEANTVEATSEEGVEEDIVKEEDVVKEEEEKTHSEPELVKIAGSGDENVLNTYTSDSWKPIGTEQTGAHTTQFQKGSADWNEMTRAIAYGAGIDEASIHLWWLGNGGSPNTAVGTVSAGNNPQSYRVHIEWVDGEGWKPVKVEELKQNNRR
jgi:cytoskeletal protein RodZ